MKRRLRLQAMVVGGAAFLIAAVVAWDNVEAGDAARRAAEWRPAPLNAFGHVAVAFLLAGGEHRLPDDVPIGVVSDKELVERAKSSPGFSGEGYATLYADPLPRYVMLVVWRLWSSEWGKGFYLFDLERKVYLGTKDYRVFAEAIQRIPDGEGLAQVDTCTRSAFSGHPYTALRLHFLLKRKHVLTSDYSHPAVVCDCGAGGIRWLDTW